MWKADNRRPKWKQENYVGNHTLTTLKSGGNGEKFKGYRGILQVILFTGIAFVTEHQNNSKYFILGG